MQSALKRVSPLALSKSLLEVKSLDDGVQISASI